MTSAAIVLTALEGSLALTVLGVGLRSNLRDTTYLLRHPAMFVRSIVAMNVLMPLLALWMTITFDLAMPVKLALIGLAMSPVPPFLPNKAAKAGGDGSYMIGLLVTMSVLAIVIVPGTVWLFGKRFGVSYTLSLVRIDEIVGRGILVPLAAGLAVRRFWPTIASRAVKPVTIVATVILVAAFIPILVMAWPMFRLLVGNGTLMAIIGMTIAGLAVGHVLGGARRDDRTVLALATAARHPGVAIAIMAAAFPSEKLVGAAVLLDLIVCALVSAPYVAWVKRMPDDGVLALAKARSHGELAAAEKARKLRVGHFPERRR